MSPRRETSGWPQTIAFIVVGVLVLGVLLYLFSLVAQQGSP